MRTSAAAHGSVDSCVTTTEPHDLQTTAVFSDSARLNDLSCSGPNVSYRPQMQTLDQMYSSRTTDRRFNLSSLFAFGGSDLMLALMGVYSVTVAQRKQEVGIRLALGALQGDVIGLFMREGSMLVGIGVVIGLAGAVAASRLLQSLLFGIQPSDVPLYVIAVVPMIVAALLASLLPARRAARGSDDHDPKLRRPRTPLLRF